MRSWRTATLQFLLALVLSLALWTYVSFTLNPSRQGNFEVAVSITPPPEILVVVDPNTGQPLDLQVRTRLQVSGPEADLDLWSDDSFRATVDLSGLEAGTHDVPITVEGPPSARVRNLEPAQLSVRLEPEQRRTVAVEPVTSGSVPFLFQADTPRISVQEATVTGPAALVAQVARIIVPISLQGRTADFSEQQQLVPVDQANNPVEGVDVEPNTANASVAVTPRVEVQRVQVVPQTTGQLATGYRFDLDWNPKFVNLFAAIPITGTLYTEPIDLTGKTESFTQTVELDNVDQSVQLLTQEPITVDVTIAPVTQPYNLIIFVPITGVNEAPNVDAAIDPPGLSITVNGTAEQFQQLQTTTVQGTVDVAGLPPGRYDRPVTVNLPAGLQIVGDQPRVSVTVTELAPSPQPTATPGG